jgi:chromosome segregation ATPase
MSTSIASCGPSEIVAEIIVGPKQSELTKGEKRPLQRKRSVARLKLAADIAQEQAAHSLQVQRESGDQLRQLQSELQKCKVESGSLSVTAKRYRQERQVAQKTARGLAAQLSEKEALVTELQFRIQDIGDQQRKASVDRVSAYLAVPANVFAAPASRHGT